VACQTFAQTTSVASYPLVTQEIRYLSPEASEVFFVWVINGSVPAVNFRPEGSFVKGNALYTPMKRKRYGFSAELLVPHNAMIDYSFWISQGTAGKSVSVYDGHRIPQQSYHTLAFNNNTILIKSKVNTRPQTPLTILDFSIPLLSVAFVLLFFFLNLRVYRYKDLPFYAGPVKIIAASAGVLSFFLILIRSSVTGQCWDLYVHPFDSFPKVLWAGFYDVLYVLSLSSLFLFLSGLFKHFTKLRFILILLFIASCLLSLITAIISVQNIPGSLYSGAFLNLILQIAMICLAGFFLVMCVIIVADLLVQKLNMKPALSFSYLGFLMLYLIIAPLAIKNYSFESSRLSNPIVASVSSFMPDVNAPLQSFYPSQEENIGSFIKKRTSIQPVKNIIVYQLPVSDYQLQEVVVKITQLRKYPSRALFVHPESKQEEQILGSIYPALSGSFLRRHVRGRDITAIGQVLRKRGYRSAYFTGRNSLSDTSHIEDLFTRWIKEDPSKPFFTKISTKKQDVSFGKALHKSDLILEKVLNSVKKCGITESTLVIITGNNNRAFAYEYKGNEYRSIVLIHPVPEEKYNYVSAETGNIPPAVSGSSFKNQKSRN
jgi:hypothetical protein